MILRIALLLFLCLSAVGAEAAPLKVALLLEHSEPSAWTNLLRSGLAQAAKEYGIEPSVIVIPEGQGQREAFRAAAASHDVVIVASDGLHEALRDNAANFRRVMFGSIDAGIRAPNIMSVTFADEQAAFLAGACAAMLSAKDGTPIIGWLSGADTPAMRSLFNGYSEGAMLAKPGCRIIQAVVGSFTASAAAAQKMARLLDNGAKAIALAAGAANGQTREAALQRGAFVIELDAPTPQGIGAIVKAADRAVLEIVGSAASGAFRGKEIIVYDLASKGVDFVPNPALFENTPPDIARRIRELRHELEAGAIKLRSLRQRTLCDCLD